MFSYPTGKKKIKKHVLGLIDLSYKNSAINLSLFVPFVGAGEIFYDIIISNNVKSIAINDIDPHIVCFWNAIIFNSNKLISTIEKFKPNAKDYFSFSEELKKINGCESLSEKDEIDIGFKKIAIHQMSFFGLGLKSKEPMGRDRQDSKYNIDYKWTPIKICNKIRKVSFLLKQKKIINDRCSNYNFLKFSKLTTKNKLFLVIPPSYKNGSSLFYFNMSQREHAQMQEVLRDIDSPWILCYDDCLETRNLYRDYETKFLKIKATNSKEVKKEMIIYNSHFNDIFKKYIDNEILL